MPNQCSAQNKSGALCSAQVWQDHLCRWHHPDLAAQREEARRKGGRARSNAARAAKAMPAALSTNDLLVTLSRAIDRVERGELEPGVVNAIAGAARTMNEIRKTVEIEQRLAALEAQTAGVASRWRA